MKNLALILFFMFTTNYIQAQQNLIYNGDFELFDSCPSSPSSPWDYQIEKCLGWSVGTSEGTSDYFNSCNNTFGVVGVPSNAVGFQQALSGYGYLGFYAWLDETPITNGHYREYIQSKLITPLQKDKFYNIEINISMANYTANSVRFLGAHFSNNKIWRNDYKPYQFSPTVIFDNGSYLSDTTNWIKLAGTFKANGGEDYITIGNFTDTLLNDTFRITPFDPDAPNTQSYYYIDNVSLIESEIEINIPNVFSPNNDGMNDFFIPNVVGLNNWNCTIYNRWGTKIIILNEKNKIWNGKINEMSASSGTYFYIFESEKIKLNGYITLFTN